jgi:hypothetical protein
MPEEDGQIRKQILDLHETFTKPGFLFVKNDPETGRLDRTSVSFSGRWHSRAVSEELLLCGGHFKIC